MRFTRPAVVLAAAAVLLVGLSAEAAKKPVSWTDQSGDANATDYVLAGSGLPAPLDQGMAGPGSSAPRDIVKVELANTFVTQGKKTNCTGFTATVTYSAPPTAADTIYRVRVVSDENPFFLIQHDTSGGGADNIRHGKAAQTSEETTAIQKPVKVVGNTLIWTITTKDIKDIVEKPGSVLTKLSSSASGSVKGILLAPTYDIATAPADASFTICK